MIEVKNLTKYYGERPAVKDLSFKIEPGHIYGFLGPNGAGKSTTMNIMTGCLAATSGEVTIGGYDIFDEPQQAKRLMGYLPEQPPLYPEQTVREYLNFAAEAKGIKKADRAEEIRKVAEETRIVEVLDRLIKHLSKGYRQRVGIAQALLGDPEVVILDEPTVGLDPAQIIEIRELVKSLGSSRTVIISSHILSEIQAICDMVLIISNGELKAFDSLENIARSMEEEKGIEICANSNADALTAILGGLEGVDSIELISSVGNKCEMKITTGSADTDELCKRIFKACSDADIMLTKLNEKKAVLEDVFLNLTAENGEEKKE